MSHQGEDTGISNGARRYTMFLLVTVYTSSFIDRSIINILIQPIQDDFHVSDTAMGFLTGFAFAIFYATLGLPVARWADRSNRRNIIALAVTIWSAMTALSGFAQNFWQLALARVGVGVGEAGSSPPSHSMIADMYPLEERTSALAIYSWGIHIGIMLGAVLGGWIAETWGWRYAFFAVGFPGLLLALLVRFTIKEPARGQSGGAVVAQENIPFQDVFRHLWRVKSLRHTIIGCTLVAFVGYGVASWGAPFLMRSHDLTVGQVGLILGPIAGFMGIIGAFASGKAADRLSLRDARWTPWIVFVCKMAAIPFIIGFYLVGDFWVAIWFLPLTVALGATYQGSTFAMVQTLSPLRMRAQASAVLLFVINLIGLGLGPSAIGIASDLLAPYYGEESLRYALFGVSMLGVWGAVHYYWAGKSYREDLADMDVASAGQPA
ncbi:MAG: spinster family MFS transporter [Alphaproteobacteria bacterium]